MTQATSHTTNTPRLAHPAVFRAVLRSHDRYDPFGRRLSKTANNQSSYYFYSAEGLIAEADSNGQIIQSYGYAPGSTFSTNPLWTKLTTAGTTTYYTYQNDHLGTPQKLLNQSGLTVWSATYDAFGKATVDPASTITNNLRFPGQYADQETGLHYNWMRFYDPKTGRYVTSDPIGLLGGLPLHITPRTLLGAPITPWFVLYCVRTFLTAQTAGLPKRTRTGNFTPATAMHWAAVIKTLHRLKQSRDW